jgi:hypothetical protein
VGLSQEWAQLGGVQRNPCSFVIADNHRVAASRGKACVSQLLAACMCHILQFLLSGQDRCHFSPMCLSRVDGIGMVGLQADEVTWQHRKPEGFRGEAHSFHNNLLSQC